MRRNRLVGLVGLAVAVCSTLSGCTVPVAGVTGIAVTDDGKPLGVMLVCHDRIDGATLYSDEEEADYLGRWIRGKPAKGYTLWRLDTGGRGWTTDMPVAALEPRRTYSLYGWTRDNSWSTEHVDFTLEQLARLEPGQVRYWKDDGYATVTADVFRSEACRGL
ncbi:hypothetical protein ACFWVC_26260 [Streptomyces sp. NPDC058691]|uniref:hypothetical protein n=1 Tax=Streptomyces sp. NPDC058691 TaxID=3346601 RepID=UPI00365172F3